MKKFMLWKQFFASVVFSFLFSMAVQATDRYVDPTGSNSNNGKEECVKLKDVPKKKNEGWTVGTCTQSNCGPDETLMCHNGQNECIKTKDVDKKLKEKGSL